MRTRRSLPALVELQLTRSWSAALEAVLRQSSTQCFQTAPAEHSMLQGCLSRGASSLRHLAAELACQRVSGCISRVQRCGYPAQLMRCVSIARLRQPKHSMLPGCASARCHCSCASCRRRNRKFSLMTAARGVLFTPSFTPSRRGPRCGQMHRRAHQLQAGHRRLRVSTCTRRTLFTAAPRSCYSACEALRW